MWLGKDYYENFPPDITQFSKLASNNSYARFWVTYPRKIGEANKTTISPHRYTSDKSE